MKAAQSGEHNWSLSDVYFIHQSQLSSPRCPFIPDIFAQWRVDTREQFIMNYICAVRNNFITVPEMLVSLYLQNKTLQPSHRKQLVVPRSFRSAEQASIMGFSFGYSTALGVREETQPLLISLWTSQCEKPQWPLEMLQRDQSKKSENVPRSPLTHFLQSWKYDMWLYKTWT